MCVFARLRLNPERKYSSRKWMLLTGVSACMLMKIPQNLFSSGWGKEGAKPFIQFTWILVFFLNFFLFCWKAKQLHFLSISRIRPIYGIPQIYFCLLLLNTKWYFCCWYEKYKLVCCSSTTTTYYVVLTNLYCISCTWICWWCKHCLKPRFVLW